MEPWESELRVEFLASVQTVAEERESRIRARCRRYAKRAYVGPRFRRALALERKRQNEERKRQIRRTRAATTPLPEERTPKVLVAQRLINLKRAPCQDCGATYPPECMDFDHRPGTEKLFAVSAGAKRFRWSVIEAEVRKCDVVCSNCHRIRTRTRRVVSPRLPNLGQMDSQIG